MAKQEARARPRDRERVRYATTAKPFPVQRRTSHLTVALLLLCTSAAAHKAGSECISNEERERDRLSGQTRPESVSDKKTPSDVNSLLQSLSLTACVLVSRCMCKKRGISLQQQQQPRVPGVTHSLEPRLMTRCPDIHTLSKRRARSERQCRSSVAVAVWQ